MRDDYDLFISHASKDAVIAQQIVQKLEESGVKCWMAPRDVEQGSDFQVAIVDAISQCRAVVLLLSTDANRSKHVLREVLLADESELPVFPLRITGVEPEGGLKFQLMNRQWLDYFELKDRALSNLIAVYGRSQAIARINLVNNGGEPPISGNREPIPSPPKPIDVTIAPPSGLRRFLPPALEPTYLFFQVRGRIGRRSYWFGQMTALLLFLLLVFITASQLAPLMDAASPDDRIQSVIAIIILFEFFFFIAALSNITVKRLHDLGVSGKWLIASVAGSVLYSGAMGAGFLQGSVTQYGAFLLSCAIVIFQLWVGFWPGKAGRNRFGPAPTFRRDWQPVDKTPASRTKPRSEFDLPFVILSPNGRIGAIGVFVGMGLALWLSVASWFYASWTTDESAPGAAFTQALEDVVVNTDDLLLYGSVYISHSRQMKSIESSVTSQERAALEDLLHNALDARNKALGLVFQAIFVLALLGMYFLTFLNVAVKRFHDLGLSGWFGPAYLAIAVSAIMIMEETFGGLMQMPGAAGVLSLLIATVFLFLPLAPMNGKMEFNQYGPPPGFDMKRIRELAFHSSAVTA